MSMTHQNITIPLSSIQGVDYVELYVSNAHQAAHYYRTAFGFAPVAYAGLESGIRDHMSIVLQSGECHLVVTAPLISEGPIAEYVLQHGDGVKDIAFLVADASQSFEAAVQWGAKPLLEPTVFEDENGRIVKATIAAYGDTVHSLIQRETRGGTFFPGYQVMQEQTVSQIGLYQLDHFAISLNRGNLAHWYDFYCKVFGFLPIHEEAIMTQNSAMSSKALESSTGHCKFVLIEPAPSKRTSQIEEFLQFHNGPGVQHIALHTQDIIQTIQALKANGIDFVNTPTSYYDMLTARVGTIDENIDSLRTTNILVDRDEWGYLLQIFSQPLQSRPTLFMEIIQRRGARGFGSGNIQALFQALEREQARRGNL